MNEIYKKIKRQGQIRFDRDNLSLFFVNIIHTKLIFSGPVMEICWLFHLQTVFVQ